MIPGLPNPWIILTVVVAFIANGFYWNHHGHVAERDAWKIEQADLDKKAGEKLLAEQQKTLESERKYQAFKDAQEKAHAEKNRYIDGMRIANGRLVAAAGGLFDKNGRPRPQGGSAGTAEAAGATGGGPGAIAGCALSQSVTDDLLDLARDADKVVNTARTCQAYVIGITDLVNAPAQ